MMVDAPKFSDADMDVRRDGDALTLFFRGRLDASAVARLWPVAVGAVGTDAPCRLVIDGAGIERCDGAGIGLLVELQRIQQEAGRAAELRNLPADARRLFDLFRAADFNSPQPAPPEPIPFIHDVGARTVQLWVNVRDLLAFVGELLVALGHAARHPRRVRWADTFLVAERAGIDSFPIVVLIGFLIGLVMAFQSGVFMREYGAEIYVANLVGLSMVRELGPLLTAIVLAGRSASSFAAEIGTMKINEEISALETMGIDPVRFLVVPRVIAGVAVTPLLSMFSIVAGLLGGGIVMVAMGYPLVAYGRQLVASVGGINMTDFMGGFVKAFAFGVLVSAAGCLRGLQTRLGAAAVGRSTTSAVVSGIILIALADSAFAVVYYYLGI